MYKYLFSNNKTIIQSYFQTVLHGVVNKPVVSPIENLEEAKVEEKVEEKEEEKVEEEVEEEKVEEEKVEEETVEEQDIDINISEIYNSVDEFEYTVDNVKPTVVELYDIYNTNEIETININPMTEEK